MAASASAARLALRSLPFPISGASLNQSLIRSATLVSGESLIPQKPISVAGPAEKKDGVDEKEIDINIDIGDDIDFSDHDDFSDSGGTDYFDDVNEDSFGSDSDE